MPSPTQETDERAYDMEQLQRDFLRRAVEQHRGSRRTLAKKLGISERTLYRRLRRLDPG
jgi:transcriptional regulator with PAS, ATPase and Fis domain